MEIEFKTEIDPAVRRLELATSLLILAGGISCFALIWFIFDHTTSSAFLVGGAIAWSLERFKKYWRLRTKTRIPDQLQFQETSLIYCTEGKQALEIPYACIERVSYREGIALQLKKPLPQKLTVLDPNFFLSSFVRASSKHKADLFFEGFSALAKARLQDIVHPDQADHLAAFQHR